MAEWPVEVVDKIADIPWKAREIVPPGQTVYVRPTKAHNEDGTQTYLVLCPNCGEMGACRDDKWSVSILEGSISMYPSILCHCGGHYWLKDGVLTEC